MPPRIKTVASISNGKFYENHAAALGLMLLGERVGFERPHAGQALGGEGLVELDDTDLVPADSGLGERPVSGFDGRDAE